VLLITRKRKRVQEKEPPSTTGEGKRRSLRNSIIATRLVNSEKLGRADREGKRKPALSTPEPLSTTGVTKATSSFSKESATPKEKPNNADSARKSTSKRQSETFEEARREDTPQSTSQDSSPHKKRRHHALAAFIMHQSKKTTAYNKQENDAIQN